uniref:Uncharacterized protein n=1 Tax=Lygus hesperus TaxID=30085 RepID=A0A146LEJ6_LYGHE
MNTLLILISLAHGVLFYNVPDVLAQPLLNHHRTAWTPYGMVRPSQQPIQMAQYISPQGRNQPSTSSRQQHQSSEEDVASEEVNSDGDYDENDYPDRSAGITEDDHYADDWGSPDEDNQDDNTDRKKASAQESQIQTPKMMQIQIFRAAQPGDWEEEDEDEEIRTVYYGDQVAQTKLPSYDEAELFPRDDQENSTTKHELIPDKHEPVTSTPSTQDKPTEPPRETSPQNETSTQKETSRVETLRKSRPLSPKLQKFETVPLQYKNYPIPHSDDPHKYMRVSERLYLNPETHHDLYSISDHSIHDSMILPVAKAAARAKLLNA